MRKTGIDPTALLVVLAATALVTAVALSTAPAYSDNAPGDPTAVRTTAPAPPSALEAAPKPVPSDSRSETTAPPTSVERTADAHGYEWSASRPADERYLWSHRPN